MRRGKARRVRDLPQRLKRACLLPLRAQRPRTRHRLFRAQAQNEAVHLLRARRFRDARDQRLRLGDLPRLFGIERRGIERLGQRRLRERGDDRIGVHRATLIAQEPRVIISQPRIGGIERQGAIEQLLRLPDVARRNRRLRLGPHGADAQSPSGLAPAAARRLRVKRRGVVEAALPLIDLREQLKRVACLRRITARQAFGDRLRFGDAAGVKIRLRRAQVRKEGRSLQRLRPALPTATPRGAFQQIASLREAIAPQLHEPQAA